MAPYELRNKLLCHTLSLGWPQVRILALTSTADEYKKRANMELHSLAGPPALLHAVEELVQPGLPGISASM